MFKEQLGASGPAVLFGVWVREPDDSRSGIETRVSEDATSEVAENRLIGQHRVRKQVEH